MSKHIGEFELGSTVWGIFVTRGSGGAAIDADAPPTFTVYGNGGPLPAGDGVSTEVDPGDDHPAGAYQVSFPADRVDGYVPGKLYTVLLVGVVSGVAWGDELTFRVI